MDNPIQVTLIFIEDGPSNILFTNNNLLQQKGFYNSDKLPDYGIDLTQVTGKSSEKSLFNF